MKLLVCIALMVAAASAGIIHGGEGGHHGPVAVSYQNYNLKSYGAVPVVIAKHHPQPVYHHQEEQHLGAGHVDLGAASFDGGYGGGELHHGGGGFEYAAAAAGGLEGGHGLEGGAVGGYEGGHGGAGFEGGHYGGSY